MAKDSEQIRTVLKRELGNIAPEADLDTLDSSADIREELDIDSFDLVRYITAVCEELGMDVPEQDYIELTTLERAETYLLKLV
ncbi:acyl carrier protein [Marinobacterium sp. YM272]|uniref:acyl carrier protein n=1 Tax=Marinobacterium sp. YM272 TaxID=3421654 RepID=UPI003D7F74D3